jgi:hypothetical protein
MKHKILFESLERVHLDVSRPDYQKAIKEVIDANEREDEDSIKFKNIISRFPEVSITGTSVESKICFRKSKMKG